MANLPKFLRDFGIGCYPPEYNPHVHGPYKLERYYGPADTAFKDVKLGDLSAWLSRRQVSPLSTARLLSRNVYYYLNKWIKPQRAGPHGLIGFCMILSFGSYIQRYGETKFTKHCKHH